MADATNLEEMSQEELKYALSHAELRLEQATIEIAYLDNQIGYLRKLYKRAEKHTGYAVRYNLRMQLSITSGVKVMYHHYAALKEDRVSEIRRRLGSPSRSPPSEDDLEDRTEA